MKRLIVNADDFGLHEHINRGIIRGFCEGFVTSTSLMCSAPAFADAVLLARQHPGLGVGIHLTLVGGVPPVLPPGRVASLLDGNGVFLADYRAFAARFYGGGIKNSELEAEMRAQIERGLGCGLKITHLDSHQHVHVLPKIAQKVVKLCCEYHIPALRLPKESNFFFGGCHSGAVRFLGRLGLNACAALAARQARRAGLIFPQHFFGMLAGGQLNKHLLGKILLALPEGVSELMTHPGLQKTELERLFHWHYLWEEELAAFLAEENKALLRQRGIVLMNFGGLIQ